MTTLYGVKEAIGDDTRDRLVRARIVTDGFRFPPYVPNDPTAAFDTRPAPHLGIGPNVDEHTTGNERAMDLMEGIDHALSAIKYSSTDAATATCTLPPQDYEPVMPRVVPRSSIAARPCVGPSASGWLARRGSNRRADKGE